MTASEIMGAILCLLAEGLKYTIKPINQNKEARIPQKIDSFNNQIKLIQEKKQKLERQTQEREEYYVILLRWERRKVERMKRKAEGWLLGDETEIDPPEYERLMKEVRLKQLKLDNYKKQNNEIYKRNIIKRTHNKKINRKIQNLKTQELNIEQKIKTARGQLGSNPASRFTLLEARIKRAIKSYDKEMDFTRVLKESFRETAQDHLKDNYWQRCLNKCLDTGTIKENKFYSVKQIYKRTQETFYEISDHDEFMERLSRIDRIFANEKKWPRSPKAIGRWLTKQIPNLKKVGWEARRVRTPHARGWIFTRIEE